MDYEHEEWLANQKARKEGAKKPARKAAPRPAERDNWSSRRRQRDDATDHYMGFD